MTPLSILLCRLLMHVGTHMQARRTFHFYLLHGGAYDSPPTSTGIGPEVFAFTSSDGLYTGGSAPTADQLTFNSLHGFYITASDYILRPEVLESNFYAWRVTGNPKYLDRAVSAVKSFNQYLSVNGAFAGLDDVNSKTSTRINTMESFWFGEVLKYL
jgi:mannosyl-oligosaccharide alpha-1,2-mannosidase